MAGQRMTRYFLVMNPGSRQGRSTARFEEIFASFKKMKVAFEHRITRDLRQAQLHAREACLDGFDVVVAVGGDGTINRVLNGFFDRQGKLISRARLGVIYTGTSPDFCRSFHVPLEPQAALETLLQNHHAEISVGMIRYALQDLPQHRQVDESDHFHTSFFACCANIGIGAQLARHANSGTRRILGDHGGTFFSLIRTLLTYRPKTLTLHIDGAPQAVPRVHNLSLGKTFHVASGIKIHHDLSPEEDRLYLLMIKNLSLWRVPRCLKSIYSGRPLPQSELFDFRYGKEFEVSGNHATTVEFDGDPAGFLPCTVSTAPDRIQLITSREQPASRENDAD